jgi:simple sugar transport system permease protein
MFTHTNPLSVYRAILTGAFGSTYNFSETLVAAIPLILISAGLLLAFKMKFWNIGAYGQYIMGAMFSSFFALHASQNTSSFILITVMCLAGLIGGALWAVISALLKLFWEVNEVISTLLLNYIALYILDYFMHGPWRDPSSHGFPLSKSFAANARLPILLQHTRIHLGLVFGIVATVVIYILIKKTKFGYENKVIGENPTAAKYAGINIFRNTLIAAGISGGLAGLAGMAQVSGIIHMIQMEINADCGYTAIIVSWLAALNPIASFFVAIILGGLEAGGYQIQMTMSVPFGIVGVIESAILFALLGGELFKTHKLVSGRKKSHHPIQ